MSSAKRKGTARERQAATRLTESGVPSRRVVMSGAAARFDARLKADVDVGVYPVSGGEGVALKAEVKQRKNGGGFVVLERWLSDNDMLILWRNRADPLVVLPWDVAVRLLKPYYYGQIDPRIEQAQTEREPEIRDWFAKLQEQHKHNHQPV